MKTSTIVNRTSLSIARLALRVKHNNPSVEYVADMATCSFKMGRIVELGTDLFSFIITTGGADHKFDFSTYEGAEAARAEIFEKHYINYK